MNEMTQRFFVLTGGPGSGKSALLDALERAGYARSVEAGRGIILDQQTIEGRALPWSDPTLFAEMMLSWEMRSYHIAMRSSGTLFFDRGVVDVLGYLRLTGLPVPKHVRRAVETFRYKRHVFIAPPWKEIYTKDRERKQDFEEAGCGPTKPWWWPTLNMDTNSLSCRASRSRNGCALSLMQAALAPHAETSLSPPAA